MTYQTVSLSALVPSKANPRKAMRDIEGLAASIKTDGLLQNLVVKPEDSKGKRFTIVSGERRYRALKRLEQRGELPENFAVPVEIRKTLSKDDTLRLATVENLQRAALAPLEETAALTKLVHKGVTLDDVAAQTGLSQATIRRRLVLNNLCKEAKKALRDGEVTLAQAEALTLGDHDRQQGMLERLARNADYSAADIKELILDERPSVALAIFPLERYTGTITADLFADEETSYFDDMGQFLDLQQAAVEELADECRASAAWVEVTDRHSIPDWQYRDAEKGEASGVLINLSPGGRVEVRKGLAREDEIDAETAAATAEHPFAPVKAKPAYAAPLRRYLAHHKSIAVQEMLLANPRKAKEVAAVKALTGLKPHECLPALAKDSEVQNPYAVIEAQTRLYASKLGLTIADDAALWSQFSWRESKDAALYEVVKTLSDHQLDELHTLLAVLSFGQRDCDTLDTGDTLFNRVAQDVAVDMKNHWKPDRSFIERRNRSQLVGMAKECGYADGRSVIDGYKKSELVDGLLWHFADAYAAADPAAAQRKALAWLPEVMQFPAVDPALAGIAANEDQLEEAA